jgi:iron complex outermembrane receptor protein
LPIADFGFLRIKNLKSEIQNRRVWNSAHLSWFRTILRVGRRGDQMRLVKVVGLLLLSALPVFSQQNGTVSGRVVRSDGSSAGWAGVEIVSLASPSIKYRVEADVDGNFRFENIPPGHYRATADSGRLSGWLNQEGEFTLVAGQTSQVTLHDVPLIWESVFVAAGQSQSVEQVSKTIDTIDAQQMRDRADFSLAESLETIPGFRVQQSGGFGRVATIKTRGLRNQDTALLIDGIRFRDPTAITGDASPFLSDFTLTSVDRVEVLRGSGSSLYGTNAIGGVVDFETPEAKSGTHGQIGGAFGGLGLRRFRGVLSHGTKNGKFGFVGAVSRTVYTKGIDGDDGAHNTNVQARVDGNPGSKTNISGRIFYSNADVRLNTSPDTAGIPPASNFGVINAQRGVNFTPDQDDPDAIQHSRFFSGQFAVTQIINSSLVLNGYYQGLKTRRRNDDGPLGPGFQNPSTSFFDGQIHTANAHIVWTAGGRNTLTSGYEFELEKYGNQGSTPAGTGNFFLNERQTSHTFYAQDLVSLDDGRLQLAGGFRAQLFRLERPTFSLTNAPYTNLTLTDPPTAYTFDGAVSYFFRSSGTKLRAHIGNGYRVPSLFERFGTFFDTFGFPNPDFVPLGDPRLKPERSIAFDAGIEQNAAKDRVRLSATYFYTWLRDIITFGPLQQPDPFGRINAASGGGYQNQRGGIARGAEFSVKARPRTSTDLFASYTFTNGAQRTAQVSGSGVIKTLGVPDHQFTLVATQRFAKRAWVNFDLLATSSYLAPVFSNFSFKSYVYRFNGNRKGDLTGGYTFGLKNDKSLRIYATIENVFNQEYYENGFRTAKATARVGTTFVF